MSTPTHEIRPKVRLLVIQLSNLADNLQSLMALRAAQQLYPQLEIHFVARESFAEAVKRVPWVHHVTTLPVDQLLTPILTGQRTEKQTLGELARWVAPLIQERWDIVVNWSYSEASSYLTGLLPAKIKLGYTRRTDLTSQSADGWSNYIHSVIQGGSQQNIHLTDILTTQILTALQIQIGDPVSDGNSPVTSKSFFSLELDKADLGWRWRDLSRKWIGIQLGASQTSKTYSPESWAKVCSYLLRRHPECSVVLLGGKNETHLAMRFSAELEKHVGEHNGKKNILSLVGQTDFDLWASVVSRCQWVLASDTSVIHLASVLGTHVLNLSFGNARFTESGPYGNGHYVMTSNEECSGCAQHAMSQSLHTCHQSISPESVYAAWSYASSEWAHKRKLTLETHFAQLGWSSKLPSVNIYRSKIRHSDDGGGIHYESQIARPLQMNEWQGMAMGHIARAWFCGWVPAVGKELKRETISMALIQKLRELDEAALVLSKVCQEATKTVSTLVWKSKSLRSRIMMGLGQQNELNDLSKRLMELDRLVERMGRTQPALLPFAQMSKVMMHNLSGTHLAELGKESAECYKHLNDGINSLREWIKHTLELSKPVAIKATEGNERTAPLLSN